jgi:hypothetical protein
MEEKENFFTESKAAVKAYIEDRILLLKLQATDKASKAVAGLVTGVLLLVFGVFALMLLSITGGFFFSGLTGSFVAGFGIMTGIFVLLIVLLLATGKKLIRRPIINGIINGAFGKNEPEPENP